MPQADLNAAVWRTGAHTADYDNRALAPAEVLLLVRYREALSGRTLDIGCGAGRVLGYLAAMGGDAHGIDISPTMVELCRRRYPGVDTRVGDLETVRETISGPFDAILMTDNVLDVLDDERRRHALSNLRDLLADAGLLMFSSHNLAAWDRSVPRTPSTRSRLAERANQLAHRSPAWMWQAAARGSRRRANRRRLAPLQQRRDGYAIINDSAHDYSLLHYYIARNGQERQLDELGFDLIDIRESDGTALPESATGLGASLYYVARPRRSGAQVFPG